MADAHSYDVAIEWTGNLGTGTDHYRSFSRAHEIIAEGKDPIAASADPAFRGDPSRWNPEELLVATVAQCHMLWFLHLCSTAGVTVVDYEDHAHGVMTMDEHGGGGQLTEVTLRPEVTVTEQFMVDKANALHDTIDEVCFIARSVNFPIRYEPRAHTV
ncbi:OsmC family peroxiredoxin [Saccharopolyspora rhizosphaerae]|uniref:OsmC family peroxiredoxin n=1 Tax=Saccharopolyspora rhizosphaerae TaxID=2492662 RepID=A0A426JKP5_9PSEU|nr:OsmC family protein [Saccharopolyspora rhizosphaerae]RRO13645.1 OsmC family peroxiredoxin [Saccharopolyspora rhizosphaerae]